MKQIRLTDFLTGEEISAASRLYGKCHRNNETSQFAVRCEREILRPVIARINAALGQENDPRFLAYMIEYVMSLTWTNR